MVTFKDYVQKEVLKSKSEFSWLKVIRNIRRSREDSFIFWYRASYVLYRKDSRVLKNISKRINNRINKKYGCDFHRKSDIGYGLAIAHLSGIVITKKVKIGKNFVIRQNTTIGTLQGEKLKANEYDITIGDNVDIGANSCIIGRGLSIGSNVTIGAMSFINKNIEPNNVYITKKESFCTPKVVIERNSDRRQVSEKSNIRVEIEYDKGLNP